MAAHNTTAQFYDPLKGGEAVRIQSLRLNGKAIEPARTNYFGIYFIESGSGTCWADTTSFVFNANSLLFFVPYQHIRLVPQGAVRGQVIQFHANFLCIETFHAEVGCSGMLFNDPYGVPMVTLDASSKPDITSLIDRMRREDRERQLAYSEVMLACLKALLIFATRLKSATGAACAAGGADRRHPVLAHLRDLIESHFRTLHLPSDYAKRLHLTPKTLGRIVREHLGTTLTDLIRNRMLIHAKWQLLHTLKPVKEISRELGFGDELYFSRLFKKATGCSPTFFRDFETRIRGGSNLSMLSAHAPILPTATPSDT